MTGTICYFFEFVDGHISIDISITKSVSLEIVTSIYPKEPFMIVTESTSISYTHRVFGIIVPDPVNSTFDARLVTDQPIGGWSDGDGHFLACSADGCVDHSTGSFGLATRVVMGMNGCEPSSEAAQLFKICRTQEGDRSKTERPNFGHCPEERVPFRPGAREAP
jgi:hypothetical protein